AGRVLDKFAAELAHDDEEKRRLEEERRREEQRRRAREERQGAAGSQLLGLASGFRVNESLFSGLGLAGQAANMFKPPDFSHQLPALAIRPPNVTLIEANRYDDLVAIAVRASQRVEDLEEELRRLRQQHAD